MSQQRNPDIESYQDYRSRIDTMADVIEEALEDDPEREIHELVHEEVDSSRMVMFTHEAMSALQHADSNPTEWRHLVSDDDSWGRVIQTMAFTAVRQDLNEELQRRDLL